MNMWEKENLQFWSTGQNHQSKKISNQRQRRERPLFLIAGYSYDPDCMYVNGTGRDYYEFYIQLNRCGTLGENTHHQDSRKNPTVGEGVITSPVYKSGGAQNMTMWLKSFVTLISFIYFSEKSNVEYRYRAVQSSHRGGVR